MNEINEQIRQVEKRFFLINKESTSEEKAIDFHLGNLPHFYSPQKKGINENTNRLIRDYFPKETDINKVSDLEINIVVNLLNKHPRKTHDDKTPNELFKDIRTCLLC
ncbi:protein of unknown function [Xenorhabdus poinarii G6]|uniref:Transposase n=1 Tax=Xenorhabdus poinarii G6 TaxID=1354304 RepID=A0A068R2V4_9GAMM|nr:protein of unknown function [Xenorhabdus poinarii G6]